MFTLFTNQLYTIKYIVNNKLNFINFIVNFINYYINLLIQAQNKKAQI